MITSRCQVIDGGLATELERRGHDLHDRLWSARLLLDAPEAIERVHFDYFMAGADIAITATYQASYEGFAERQLTSDATTALLRRAVTIADAARHRAHDAGVARPLRIAASVGPFGASRHDGSEYRGDYGLNEAQLVSFHCARLAVLAGAGADLLACETIPSLLEARALVQLLRDHVSARAWVTFSCRDERRTSAGDDIGECARWLDRQPQVVAMGVNCVAPEFVASLITHMRAHTQKPIVVYPNSGEMWDAARRCWVGTASRFTECVPRWMEAGAAWIGGCCRSTPEDIGQVRADVDRFSREPRRQAGGAS
ncbi:MAG: homocysteine S-methyltransferase [Gemmatimonadaceae bacterium]